MDATSFFINARYFIVYMTRPRCLHLLSVLLLLLGASPTFGSAPQRLTSHPAADYQPTVSADAQFLAFVSTRSGNEDIWIKPLGNTGMFLPRQITTHPASDYNPDVNRDGTSLLYVSHKTDPRGDIYVRDLITGEEEQLTNLSSGDAFPQWAPQEKAFFYLKTHPLKDTSAVYRKSLGDEQETLIIPDVTSFSVGTMDTIVYANDRHIAILNIRTKQTTIVGPPSPTLDLWPTILPNVSSTTPEPFIFFTRYARDTNGDGQLDADDESSVWLQSMATAQGNKPRSFRLTPAQQFHAYPTAAGTFLYYADLKRGDLFRIDVPSFLKDYDDVDQAKALATSFQDTGQPDQALLVLTNISRNLLSHLSPEAQADFDFSLAEVYVHEHNFSAARQAISRHHAQPGRIGALASIYDITLRVQESALTASAAERDRLITTAITELLDLGKQDQAQEEVSGNAFIAAGRLHLFANHPLKALDFLIKVDDLQNKDVRAKALFSRGEAYQALGDTTNILQVFVDVIHMFGENSSWGRRAILRALDLSQQDKTPQDAITALNRFMAQHADLPVLSATARLRVATIYDALGEQGPALESLESILTTTDVPRDLTIQAYQHKAGILSSAERFQEAADTYATLGKFAGEGQGQLKDTQDLLVLQLVKKALKDRKIGETRIAAKSLKHLIDQYPHSVEAHRAYIETKSMLKEAQDIQL